MFFPSGDEIIGFLIVTKGFIKRCVLALLFYCRAPVEGIVTFFDLVIGHHVSKGGVYNITAEATQRAKEFDRSVSLSGINTIAVDEIFQGDAPVLTTVDLDTRFVVMMDPTDDRSGDTWKEHLDGQKGERPLSSSCGGGRGHRALQGGQGLFWRWDQPPGGCVPRNQGHWRRRVWHRAQGTLQARQTLRYRKCAPARCEASREIICALL